MKNKFLQNVLMISRHLLFGVMLQCLLYTFLLASEGNAQVKSVKEVKVNINLREVRIEDVFRAIENKTEFSFVFAKGEVPEDVLVTIAEGSRSVRDILMEISKLAGLKFQQVNRNISVKRLTSKDTQAEKVEIIIEPIHVTGRVTSEEDGSGLPGVTVLVKGTTEGTVTDTDGNYALDVPEENSILQFSSIGYVTKEIAIENRKIIDVSLVADVLSLQEVVVIGYGTQNQREVTGSIATLEAKQLEDQPVGQFTQKLQGRIAGVQINQISGTPGRGMAIRIRGAASINAGNNPLFVVDGFPIVGDINNINPNEIETFSVLKGASAAALYGSRAANGVVLITTKRAKPGQTVVQFSASHGFSQVPQRGRADLMNAKEFLQDRKEIFEDKIRYEGYTGGIPELYQNPEGYTGKSTNWYDELLQSGSQNSYNLSLLSGRDKINSATTVGYFKEDGVVINTGFKRYSLRSNNEYEVNDFIRVGLNVAPTYQKSLNQATDGFYAILYTAIITPPIFSPDDTNEDGSQKVSFTGPGLFTFPNWKKTMLETTDVTDATRLLSNAYIDVDFLKNFYFKSSLSLDLGNDKRRVFNPSTTGSIFAPPPKLATGSYATTSYDSWLIENTLHFNKTFAASHNIDGLVGYSAQKFRLENNLLTGTGFPDNAVTWIDAAAIRYGSSNATEWSLLSMYSRVNYNFKGKYLLSASVRRDGSSRFGSENRWGTFPSVSAGWIISDENFAKTWSDLSYLKLRGEYGFAGNFNIGNYSQYGNITSSNYVFGNSLAQGRSPVSIGNPYLTWETTQGMDIGMDVGLFNDRISVTADYYDKTTSNMLYQVDIPYGTGFANIQDNIGEFHFWGYEFSVNTQNLTGALKWNTDLNISFNRNKVIKLGTNNTPLGGLGEYSSGIWKTEVGRPIGQFFGYVFDGIYKTQEEFDTQPKHLTSALGTIRFKDLNNDGKIDNQDRTYIGNPNPKFVFGINNTLGYKNFDLNVAISGAYGGRMYYSLAEWSETLEGIFNVEKYMKDRWRSVEDPGAGIIGRSLSGTTAFPRTNQDRLALDGSHLTVKNVTLGYTLPSINKNIRQVRIYATIQQALVLTKYKGANPEASWQGLNGLQEGVDVSPYPIPRTYAFGLNLNF